MRAALVLIALAYTALAYPAVSAAAGLKSPDGRLAVTFDLKDIGPDKACPVYRLAYKGKVILRDSRLGLDLEPAPFRGGMSVTREARDRHDTTWQPVCGERAVVRDHYNELTIDLEERAAPYRLLRLTFRAYDEGLAFRYTLPAQPALKEVTIVAERTRFVFSGDHPAWAVYQAQGDYSGGPIPLSQVKPGVERPLTLRVADDLYAAVTEAGLVDYARMKLRLAPGEPHALEAFLDAEKGRTSKVKCTAPFSSPWRVVMVADTPGGLLEHNDLILNLNDPCALADTSWIRPGKVIRDVTLTTAGGKACVDFCIRRGLQFVLFDAGWYGPEGDPKSDARAVDPKRADRLDIQEVVRYGNERGVGAILYVNTRALERQMDEIFPLYQRWGVKGVKFGFVNVGSQRWTAWVHEGVRNAAAHRLMVDVHDEFRSTGYQRTYPNLMTVEGVGGNEEFPLPAHNATLPFTRFLTGPADYTYCWYSPRLRASHAHQLALSTIYFSPWQVLFWYDRPAQDDGDAALEYWRHLPTCWDETRVLQGEIGKSASVARRRGQGWFVGSIRVGGGEWKIPLSFLPTGRKFDATVYSDGDIGDPASKAVKVERLTVDSTTLLTARMCANGGQAVRLVPASPTPK
jgi:alpha-glucosidase